MSINKVILSGNVGGDPEIKKLESGKTLAKFSLATSDKNKAKTTQWHNIICWEGTAEIVEKYVRKGNYITVVGSISYREYEKDGVKKYFTEINVHEIELPPKRINNPDSQPPLKDGQGEYRGNKVDAKTSDISELGDNIPEPPF